MSWSVSAIGKSAKVAEKLADDFAKMNYLHEPENEIAAAIGQAIVKAVADTTYAGAVRVEASGSMSGDQGNHAHSINVTVTPIYGFVE